MKQELVSIIIPVYNVEEHIAATMRSACAQTYPVIEYILVDDCGQDHSVDVALAVAERCGRNHQVRLTRQPGNTGAAAARNAGMRLAQGDYIFFLDADDLLQPRCIELLLDAIHRTGAPVAVANLELVGQKSVHMHHFGADLQPDRALHHFFSGTLLGSPCNKLIVRRHLLDNQLWFEPGLLQEDILWAYRLYSCTSQFVPVEETTYQYIVRVGSSSRAQNSKHRIESLLSILGTIRADYLGRRIPDSARPACRRYLDAWRFTTALLLLYYAGPGDEARQLYRQLQAMALPAPTWKGRLLQLPYALFRILLWPPYTLYKRYQ